MRNYIITSGTMFGLLVAVHAFRLIAEGLGPIGDPIFLLSTLASAAMCVWAWFAFRSARRPSPRGDA